MSTETIDPVACYSYISHHGMSDGCMRCGISVMNHSPLRILPDREQRHRDNVILERIWKEWKNR